MKKMRLLLTIVMAIIMMSMTAQTKSQKTTSEWVTIQNGQLWKTATGAVVQAHAPGFLRVGNIWYMCGEDRSRPWNPDVNLYSSTDLKTWKFENKITQNGLTTSELGRTRMIERPKLLYNAKTGKYLVWCHYESRNYGASEAACFESDSVNGTYKYVWSGRPLGVKSRDCNVFQDSDGTAYFISTTEENQHLGLFRLSDDYHEAVEHTQLFPMQRREAPAIVKLPDGRYFMFNSACSGWAPNQCKWSTTMDLKSGWTRLANVGNSIAYDTQAAAILEIKGTKTTTYLYVGDRWQDPGLAESKTIIFPVSFQNDSTPHLEYRERFDINFTTGEWRETPTDGIFADKSRWTVIDESTHHLTIDMGKSQTIKGFLVTPQMNCNDRDLIRKYDFLVSHDGKTWTSVSTGDWLPYYAEVDFTKCECRYLKLVCKEGNRASLAKLDVILNP
jgi:sucrose-6-phosphate hydrolase SacC (GH32 family)